MKCRCSNCGWLEVNPSGAMFCGYSDKRTWEDESCLAWKDKDEPQTNADRIRQMSDEELAQTLYWLRLDALRLEGFEGQIETTDEILDWLKAPVEVET